MTSAQLLLRLRAVLWALRALGASKTGWALVMLYGLSCCAAWLVSNGYILPDGTVELRIWDNGHIINIHPFNAWRWGGGLAAALVGFGLYGRAMAKGPLFSIMAAVAPKVAAVVQVLAEESVTPPAAEPERPAPVVLQPVGLGTGASLGTAQLGKTVGGES